MLRKRVIDPDRLYRMSRHFVWLIPVSDLSLFLTLALLSSAIVVLRPHAVAGLFSVCFATCNLTGPAGCLSTDLRGRLNGGGVGVSNSSRADTRPTRPQRFRRFMRFTFPVGIAIVLVLAGSIRFNERSRKSLELSRPLPARGATNVLLIVLDTVAASHLSLHGYFRRNERMTLDELADRGIQFDSARTRLHGLCHLTPACSQGNLCMSYPSAGSRRLTRASQPLPNSLAIGVMQRLASVANTFYWTDSGLARGFAYYDDFIFPELTCLKTAVLVRQATWEVFQAVRLISRRTGSEWAAIFSVRRAAPVAGPRY